MNDERKKPLPAALQAAFDKLFREARKQVAQGSEVLPAVLIVGKTERIVMPLEQVGSKDHAALAVRELARLYEAAAVLLITEAWSLPDHLLPRTQAELAALMQRHGSVEHMPGRVEVVSIQVETHSGHWLGRAPITRQGRVKRLGDMRLEYVPLADASGRFTHFLTPQAAPPAPPVA